MSIHSSLRMGSGMVKHRNVLSRSERLERLEQHGRWNREKSVLGLPKVRSIKMAVKKKKKDEEDEA